MAGELPPVFRRDLVKQVIALHADGGQGGARGHPGLLFDRYLPIWSSRGTSWEVLLSSKESKDLKREILLLLKPDLELLQDVHDRLDGLLGGPGGNGQDAAWAEWSTASRLAIGLGAEHPWENGFSLDFSCGVPVLPGSALKGLCRAWAKWQGMESKLTRRLFGSELGDDEAARAGDLVFLPAYPAPQSGQSLLEWDLLNPHLPGYYRATQEDREARRIEAVPTDDPLPVSFLAVPAGVPFVFRLLSRPGSAPGTADEGLSILARALADLGIGAKTAVGYGIFRTKREERPRSAICLLSLNASGAPDETAIERALLGRAASLSLDHPDRPQVQRFQLTGAPLDPLRAQAVDWADLKKRVGRLKGEARAWNPGSGPVRVVVYGLAPPQAFFHLGHLWGPGGGDIEVFDQGDLVATESGGTPAQSYFEPPFGVPAQPAQERGLIALHITSEQGEPDWASIASAVTPEPIAGRVSLVATRSLRRADGPAAARQLREALSLLSAQFPRQQGLVVSIQGPPALAFLAGWAIPRNLFRKICVPSLGGDRYVPGLVLP
jgi:CRISPR type III-B/RAMP module RAMP protein Cmr6